MKKFTKTLCLMIAAVMILASCGDNPSAANQPAPQQTENSGQAAAESPAPDGSASESAAPEGTVSSKDILVVAVTTEISKLDPGAPNLIAANQIMSGIYDLLITKDADGNFQPSVATEWEQVDDTTIKFILRDDVYFHNGEKLTAHDAAFSIKHVATEPGSASLMSSFDPEGTHAEDDTTLIVKLKTPFAAALAYLAGSRGHILCEKAVTEMGVDEHAQAPIGSGPYKFVDWVTGDRVELVRNDEYWGGAPPIKDIIFRIIPDSSIRAIELESGGVDLTFGIGPEDMERLSADSNLTVYSEPGYTHEMLQFNMRTELPIKDVNVRKAMAHALDIPKICQTVYGDMAVPADSIFATGVWGHIALGPYEYDPELSKQLLTEAGYPDGFDIEITVPENRETQNMLEIAQAMWKEVGVNVSILSFDQATMKERNAAGVTQFGRSNFTASSGDPDHAMSNWAIGYQGVFNANDEVLNDMMAAARAEYDMDKRLQMYDELQRYCWDSYWSIPLIFPNITVAHSANLAGFTFSPTQVPVFSELYFE